MTDYFIKQKYDQPVDPQQVNRDWHNRGFSCGEFTDPPGREWNNFVHHCNELLTVVEGQLELTMAGKTFHVMPGDEVYIPEGENHSVKNIHHQTTVWLYGYD